MFEKAVRQKLRFATSQGFASVEDLWDLPLTSKNGRANLDDIAKALDAEVKKAPHVSFVTPSDNAADATTQLMFDIVLHVINTRIAENSSAMAQVERNRKKQHLYELIERKKDSALEAATLEELQAMVEAL